MPSLPRSCRTPAAWMRSTRSVGRSSATRSGARSSPTVREWRRGAGSRRSSVSASSIAAASAAPGLVGLGGCRSRRAEPARAPRAAWSATAIRTRSARRLGRRPVSGLVDRHDAEDLSAQPAQRQQQHVLGMPGVGPGTAAPRGSRADISIDHSGARRAARWRRGGRTRGEHRLPLPPRGSGPEQRRRGPRRRRARRRALELPALRREVDGDDWNDSSERIASASASSTGIGPWPPAAGARHREHAAQMARTDRAGRARGGAARRATAASAPPRRPRGCGRRPWPRRARRRRAPAACRHRRRRRRRRSRRSGPRRSRRGCGSASRSTAARTRSAATAGRRAVAPRRTSRSSSPPKR